jgi:hypothetical protein
MIVVLTSYFGKSAIENVTKIKTSDMFKKDCDSQG